MSNKNNVKTSCFDFLQRVLLFVMANPGDNLT